jgi:hypothetical protein
MSGPFDIDALAAEMAAARDAAEALAARPMAGLRAVRPGTGGLAWLVAFEGPAFLCLGADLRPVGSLARVRDVAQASLAAEVVEDMVDADALRALRPHVDVLAPWRADMPAAVDALGRAAGAAEDLAEWRDAPERIVASLVAMDAAVGMQERAHAAYATFVGVTEPLVSRQDELDRELLAALASLEQAAGEAGLGASLGKVVGEGMGAIVEAADELAAAHLTPLR